MILSAYHINRTGKLCYTGLPIHSNDITIYHHNGKPYRLGSATFTIKWSHPIIGVEKTNNDNLTLTHNNWMKKEPVYPIDPYLRPDLRE